MKHFPGDGSDERDPHVCTSINGLSCEEWDNSYGKIYKGMIDAGVQSLMTGHIMMPAYQRHFNPGVKNEDLMPATICPELLQGLLREKLGFNGLIVTDASHMVGLTARAKRRDLVPGAIMAGCDMFLFYNDIEEDTRFMKEALHDGRLTKERLHEALQRIMALKAVAGLDTFALDKFPSKDGLSVVGCEVHKKVADEVSDRSITLAKQTGENIFPITPKKNKRILLVEVGPKPSPMLVLSGQMVDGSKMNTLLKEGLEKRGFEVEVYVDPLAKMMAQMQATGMGDGLMAYNKAGMGGGNANKGMYGNKQSIAALTDNYDLVLCYANVSATMKTTQRLEWAISKGGWDNPWYVNELPTVFVSFNCPFHLADVPQIKNYINCYDAGDSTIEALIKKLTGESKFTGVSPVDVFCGMLDTTL
jgi:beta-N-acetylhexosaminidase